MVLVVVGDTTHLPLQMETPTVIYSMVFKNIS